MKDALEGIAYDESSQSIIKLNNGMVLYLREVNKYESSFFFFEKKTKEFVVQKDFSLWFV